MTASISPISNTYSYRYSSSSKAAGGTAVSFQSIVSRQQAFTPDDFLAGTASPSQSEASDSYEPASTGNDVQEASGPADEEEQQDSGTGTGVRGTNGEELTAEELQYLNELKARDTEVRQHEQAHIAAGGGVVTSGAVFSYQRCPDGRNYATGGDVGIDASPEEKPEDTIAKMEQVQRAAPEEPGMAGERGQGKNPGCPGEGGGANS